LHPSNPHGEDTELVFSPENVKATTADMSHSQKQQQQQQQQQKQQQPKTTNAGKPEQPKTNARKPK